MDSKFDKQSSFHSNVSCQMAVTTTSNNIPLNVCCYDISSSSSKSLQFLILTSLTFVFFLIYGYLQELLFQLPGFGNFTWYLTLVQFFFYSCFAIIESVLKNDLKRKFEMNLYIFWGIKLKAR
jgi:hypothetical protein